MSWMVMASELPPPEAALLLAALSVLDVSVAGAEAVPEAEDAGVLDVPVVLFGFEADAALLSLSAPVLDGASLRFSSLM